MVNYGVNPGSSNPLGEESLKMAFAGQPGHGFLNFKSLLPGGGVSPGCPTSVSHERLLFVTLKKVPVGQ